MIVDLPELSANDVLDIIRVLTVITNAFAEHHQVQLQQQIRSEQPELFDNLEEGSAPF